MAKKQQVWHSVKMAMPITNLSTVRRWLIDNCGRRWTATNYKNQPLDWRTIGQTTRSQTATLYAHMDMTTHIHFKHRDDMMLFLLVWPGEVLIKEQYECKINKVSNK